MKKDKEKEDVGGPPPPISQLDPKLIDIANEKCGRVEPAPTLEQVDGDNAEDDDE